ncbi:MAG: sigma-54-dependent Fis family transcriptional regulator, partial [Gemmatimonadetes bacterium]|nr:sigma-54-dependent Fis family transcriptional regulator [Gemmatimonadota bacterium]
EEHPVLREFRGESEATARLFEELVGLAEFDLPVLILGETGTGKELVARAVHELSGRRSGTFEAINCAAIPRELMASTLFGHERGAFTGAVNTRRGAFERAGRGTVFLDEIGDMPAETQASLLRVLQEGSFCRVGGETQMPAPARVISATNADLGEAVGRKEFRSDLFYRLQMFSVRIPPLRERPEDLPEIAEHVLARNTRGRRPVPSLTPEFADALRRHPLAGNVRELESLIVGALVRAGKGDALLPKHLSPTPSAVATPSAAAPTETTAAVPDDPDRLFPFPKSGGAASVPHDDVPSYEGMERRYIQSVLELTEGNKKEAAELMGIPRTTLNARMKKLGMTDA